MIRRKYANMRIYEDNIDFADVENTITYSLSAKNLENNLNKREEELCNKISDLEAKLAEKDAERELDNSFWKQECDSLQKTLADKEKEIENLTEELDDKNFCKDFVDLYTENRLKTQLLNENWKDKISFTIQQLEKVKELCREKFNWWENSEWEGNIYDKSDVSNAYFDIEANIEEQINELKGKVEDVKD